MLHRRALTVAVIVVAALSLTGCGSSSGSDKAASESSADGKTVTVTKTETSPTTPSNTIANVVEKGTPATPAQVALGKELLAAMLAQYGTDKHIAGPASPAKIAKTTNAGYEWATATFKTPGTSGGTTHAILYRAPEQDWQYGTETSVTPCTVPYEALQGLHLTTLARPAFDAACQTNKLGSASGANDGLRFQTMSGLVTCRLRHHNGPNLNCYRVGAGDGYSLTGNSLTPASIPDIEADGVTFQDATTHDIPLDGVTYHCTFGYDRVRCTASSSGGHGFEITGDKASKF